MATKIDCQKYRLSCTRPHTRNSAIQNSLYSFSWNSDRGSSSYKSQTFLLRGSCTLCSFLHKRKPPVNILFTMHGKQHDLQPGDGIEVGDYQQYKILVWYSEQICAHVHFKKKISSMGRLCVFHVGGLCYLRSVYDPLSSAQVKWKR